MKGGAGSGLLCLPAWLRRPRLKPTNGITTWDVYDAGSFEGMQESTHCYELPVRHGIRRYGDTKTRKRDMKHWGLDASGFQKGREAGIRGQGPPSRSAVLAALQKGEHINEKEKKGHGIN